MKNISVLSKRLINNYQIRTESDNGVDYIVVPVVMMVEGVHNGSAGPILYTAEQLSQNVERWNDEPIVINHPMDSSGNPISAHSETVGDEIVGMVRNATMDNLRLLAEAWLRKDSLNSLSPTTLQKIQAQTPIDVSVGVISNSIEERGVFQNEPYIGIANNIIPDHLALLPEDRGACSWDDGCGIRNKLNVNNKPNKNENVKMDDVKFKIKEINNHLLERGLVIDSFAEKELVVNDIGYRQVSQLIQRQLDSIDTNTTYHFLEDAFDGYFIYRVTNSQTRGDSYFKRSYTISNNAVEFSNDAIEVVKTISYDEITQNSSETMKRTKFNNLNPKQMSEKKASSCKVTALIQKKATSYTEDGREWLSTFEDAQLEKMVPKEVEVSPTPAAVTVEQIQAVLNSETDPEKFIDKFMPAGMRESVKAGIALNKEKRTALIKGITANSTFTEEELGDWSTPQLQKTHDAVVKDVADYSLNGGSNANESDEESDDSDMEFMLNLKSEKENG